MATTRPCLAQLSKLSSQYLQSILTPISARSFSANAAYGAKNYVPKTLSKAAKAGIIVYKTKTNKLLSKKKAAAAAAKKKKPRTVFKQYDPRDAEYFSLLDAMRYIKAFEVGQKPSVVKYELAVKFKTLKNGPVIRNRLRLPHPVKTDIRIWVVCPVDSKYATAAKAAGATLVGEDDIFEAVKDGRIEFDRCICQTNSLDKLSKAGLGRVLGPRGLMPSAKMGTVVKDPAVLLKDMVGGAEYREKLGVARMSIGQLGFTPEEVQKNIKAFMGHVKKDMAHLSDKINKEIAEIVLSSTNAPGFPLSGDFQGVNTTVSARELSIV